MGFHLEINRLRVPLARAPLDNRIAGPKRLADETCHCIVLMVYPPPRLDVHGVAFTCQRTKWWTLRSTCTGGIWCLLLGDSAACITAAYGRCMSKMPRHGRQRILYSRSRRSAACRRSADARDRKALLSKTAAAPCFALERVLHASNTMTGYRRLAVVWFRRRTNPFSSCAEILQRVSRDRHQDSCPS